MQKETIQKWSPSQIHYTYYSSVSELPVIDWKSLGADNSLFFSLDYLKTLEDALSKTSKFTYIVFTTPKNVIVGFAVTQLISIKTKEVSDQQLPCIINEGLKSSVLKKVEVSILVCGNLFSCGEYGFVFNKNFMSASNAYQHLTNALLNTKKINNSDKPSFILIKEFWPESIVDSNFIKKQDFKELSIDANMILNVSSNWYSFDDYLDSMRTKFRTRAKKVLANSKPINVVDFSDTDIENYKNEISELYKSVIKKAHFKLGQLNTTVFKNLKSSLKNRFLFKGYFLDNTLIGFSTCFIHKNSIEAFHVGFDYSYKKSHNIYQRMLYDYVDLAINKKVSQLHLGRTAETIKSCIGAQPIDMKLYIRHRNSIPNTLLKPLAGMVTPNEFEIRKPFKKTQSKKVLN